MNVINNYDLSKIKYSNVRILIIGLKILTIRIETSEFKQIHLKLIYSNYMKNKYKNIVDFQLYEQQIISKIIK